MLDILSLMPSERFQVDISADFVLDTCRDLLSKNIFAIAALNAILNTTEHQVFELAL